MKIQELRQMTIMACTGGSSREALYYGQQTVLLSELKTSDVKYMAMETAKKEIWERKEKLPGIDAAVFLLRSLLS